jgi:hypothetical protein
MEIESHAREHQGDTRERTPRNTMGFWFCSVGCHGCFCFVCSFVLWPATAAPTHLRCSFAKMASKESVHLLGR